MKPTLNINLAGYPFTIDDDAYRLLKDYLDTIRYAFETDDDTGEIASDIESRIAEILIENEGGKTRIISLEEISKVIERIGKPSEFIEVEEEIHNHGDNKEERVKIEEENITPPPYNSQTQYSRNPFVRKKIFRDPQNALLGGVCAGLAAYMHIDVTIVRIVTVLLFFLSATTVAIAYIILWIVVPEANTPLQRMQMMGEDPTMENIGKTVTENFQGEDKTKASGNGSDSGVRKFITGAFSIFVKCIVILCFIIGFPVLLAILLVLLACIIAFFAAGGALIGGGIFGDAVNFSAPGGGVLALYLLLASIGAIITLGIPFWLIIRMAFKKNTGNISPNNRRSLVIIWLIGIALTAVFTVKSVKKVKYLDHEKWGVNIENLELLNNLDREDIKKLNINKGEITVTTKEGKKYKVAKGKVTVVDESEKEVAGISVEPDLDKTETISDSITVTENISTEVIKDSIN